jgi:hypothetical protein
MVFACRKLTRDRSMDGGNIKLFMNRNLNCKNKKFTHSWRRFLVQNVLGIPYRIYCKFARFEEVI